MSGELCYKKNDGRLAFKSGGGSLIYKAETGGDIVIGVYSDKETVGPIPSCGNTHSVKVSFGGAEGIGEVQISVAPTSRTIQGTTESVGCSFPEENPQVTLTVAVVQPSTGVSFEIAKYVQNVATGSFSVELTVNGNKILTGVQ